MSQDGGKITSPRNTMMKKFPIVGWKPRELVERVEKKGVVGKIRARLKKERS